MAAELKTAETNVHTFNVVNSNDENKEQVICCDQVLLHRCWMNEKCCCCLKLPCCESSRRQFIVYNVFNIIRFISIATMILIANLDNINQTREFWPNCCNCYYISHNVTKYDETIASNARFDLSICMPHCTDCSTCDDLLQGQGIII